jgi:hypothetical protein
MNSWNWKDSSFRHCYMFLYLNYVKHPHFLLRVNFSFCGLPISWLSCKTSGGHNWRFRVSAVMSDSLPCYSIVCKLARQRMLDLPVHLCWWYANSWCGCL